jgi:hypothetical protein
MGHLNPCECGVAVIVAVLSVGCMALWYVIGTSALGFWLMIWS